MADVLIKPEIVAADEGLMTAFKETFMKFGFKPGKHGWRTVKTWTNVSPRSTAPLLLTMMLDDITSQTKKDIRELGNREKLYFIFQGHLPVQAIADRMARLDVRNEKKIHLVESENVDEREYIERLLLALDCQNEDNHILDAWWEENVFVVVSPGIDGFKKLRVPLEKLRVLKKCSKKDLSNFKIDEDGLFVYWPKLDVHLGWEQFLTAVDKKALLKAKQQSQEFNKRYGAAVKRLRQEKKLLQKDIKGLTARQVGRIERGECRATHTALTKLAKAHKMNISDYMDALSRLL